MVKITTATLLSAIAFLLTIALVAQVWVAIFFPPLPHWNIMRVFVP